MNFFICLMLSVTLFGCAEVTLIKKADNLQEEKAIAIQCLKWDACFLKADELCSDGYNILSQSDSFGKKIDILCTEDQTKIYRARPPKKSVDQKDSQSKEDKNLNQRIQKNQKGEAVEKIIDLKP